MLFYNDVTVYGGHEVMFVNALSPLLSTQSWEIGVVYSRQNERLETELERLKVCYPSLILIPRAYTSGRLQFLRTSWAYWARRRLNALFHAQAPDCVVAVQGEISLSAVGVLAAKDAGCYTISYLPLAHTRKQRGESLAWLKDKLLCKYYQIPDHFITISESMRSLIRERGAKQPIDIVENGITMDVLRVFDKAEAREKLSIPKTAYVAALCGRIEFRQKGHDILLKALAGRSGDFNDWIVLIIGSGPDQSLLERMITELGLTDKVMLVPWQMNLSWVYSAIDMLLLPSRYEGVPVVMLEAMSYGLPIVGTNIDAMGELLPAEWLFPAGDDKAFSERMLQIRFRDSDVLCESNRRLVAMRFTKARQEKEFERVLNRCVQLGRNKREKYWGNI